MIKRLFTRYKKLILQLGSIIIGLIIVLAILGFSLKSGGELYYGMALLIALAMGYAVSIRHLRSEADRRRIYRNKYHDVFFKGTVIFAVLLSLMGIGYGVLSYFEGGNPYRIVGLMVTVVWVSVFMIYFVWAVYFYNINYGITDEEWAKIEKGKEMQQYGMQNASTGQEEPLFNPYRSQTFGLPPGTVRGMIAFTLLVGGISLLISSYGMDYVSNAEMALRTQQFEFFETAFLMMIAFYFGDRSLKYLRDRWTVENKTKERGPDPGPDPANFNRADSAPSPIEEQGDFPNTDPVAMDDLEFLEEDLAFRMINDIPSPPNISSLKKGLITAPMIDTSSIGKVPTSAFVQIRDNANDKVLIDEEIMEALDELRNNKGIDLSLAVVKALISVESSGRGHLPDGRAKILFEGHKFWYWMSKVGKSTEELEDLQKQHPTIIYPKWTTSHYKMGADEYQRLNKAKEIAEGISNSAPIYASSWGLFQILGENITHNIQSRHYKDAEDFEAKQHEAEYYHFLDFMAFIQHKKVKDKALIHYISEENQGQYDWASFAYGYNGRGYKVSQYDIRLAKAYQSFKAKLK
ncbi:hypothetical protein GCM10007049_05660 [Echinicola pacifica]|uniref:N-acetylmuramidase domain-containing protein n=1 Tax=Echinicola pacifica TaxID=346377 RepID=A0A918PMK6_9BACT|nr:N-acetylmuramidase family protein [Echinicola pacifica]GGZ16247.1 hypothetical protein GCM10007049_05660 [Echinicola pacifica]